MGRLEVAVFNPQIPGMGLRAVVFSGLLFPFVFHCFNVGTGLHHVMHCNQVEGLASNISRFQSSLPATATGCHVNFLDLCRQMDDLQQSTEAPEV